MKILVVFAILTIYANAAIWSLTQMATAVEILNSYISSEMIKKISKAKIIKKNYSNSVLTLHKRKNKSLVQIKKLDIEIIATLKKINFDEQKKDNMRTRF